MKENYDKENDIISVDFGKVKHSRELNNVNILLDFDKDDNIVGFEIFDYMDAMMKSQSFIDKLFSSKKNYSQQCKKGEGVPLHNSLEPRSETGEENKTVMPVDADNHSADSFTGTNTKTKCELSIDGQCRGNFSPLKCDGLDIPKECLPMMENKSDKKWE